MMGIASLRAGGAETDGALRRGDTFVTWDGAGTLALWGWHGAGLESTRSLRMPLVDGGRVADAVAAGDGRRVAGVCDGGLGRQVRVR